MTAFCNVDGETVLTAELVVPNVGPWWAEVVFEAAPELAGAVTLHVGERALSGTIDAGHDGTFGEQRRTRIVGGGGGWATLLGPLHYHNDAGVSALGVAQDAAREAGESLGAFAPASANVGIDYVRNAGAAARVLEDVIGGVPWYVDFDGNTVVGERASVTVEPDAYTVLDADPRESLVTVAADDIAAIPIGGTLSDGLDAPVTARELQMSISADAVRVVVWGGGEAAGRGRLARALTSIAQRSTDGQLFGRYRYRVVAMSGERVELQAVSSDLGIPDVLPISMRPGVAGAHAELTGGSIVLVEFVEGDRTLPVVSAFTGVDDEGHAPSELDLSVTATLRLGGDGATEGVALGDSLKSWLDGHTHAAGTLLDSMAGAVTGATGAPLTSSPSPSGVVKVVS